ncbi:hypothetical protein GNI_006890 [Gregarina niphandrodes]|uniref:Uncharacterized protein n=1 Tax=Gregarina niphandrodes TaxID=110365 RepID=A0A023BDB5_GRENI|nr:hypothetical protein GNI_006890 [Gregarina niphandrodes]EZG87451.1 hypothetical protein GNI_006890 [Gregarina niphandrodes]|eukprot:XP_011128656.1 hypothetical protein GNI_006890 [Gregarina niphandrodes]
MRGVQVYRCCRDSLLLTVVMQRMAGVVSEEVVTADEAKNVEEEAKSVVEEVKGETVQQRNRRLLMEARKLKAQQLMERESQRQAEESLRRAAALKKAREEHQFNFERFVLKKKTYEAEPDSAAEKLRKRALRSPEDLKALQECGAFEALTLSQLRGAEFMERHGDTAAVNGFMRMYRKNAANLWKIPETEVTGDMIGEIGAYFRAKEAADEAYRRERYNDAYQLRDWPGVGFDGYSQRKLEELWSLYDTRGKVLRDRLPADCDVIHFAGVGEVVVHASAAPLSTVLQEQWATKRWEYLNPLDARIAVADIRRTQGSGAITQILNIIAKIIQSKVEARSSAEDDFDYAFQLSYVSPHHGTLAEIERRQIRAIQNEFLLSQTGARCHNNILPDARLRYNLSKSGFGRNFFLELSLNNGISYKSIKEIEDP